MDISVADLCIVALACQQIVEIFHHGELFGWVRMRLESWLPDYYQPTGLASAVRGFLGRLTTCPFCLSVWVGLSAVVEVRYPLGRLLLCGFAVSRLANLLNDLFHQFCRTPRVDDAGLVADDDVVGDDANESI